MDAYMDMVTNDKEFLNVTSRLTEKELKPIKENLREVEMVTMFIQPLIWFKESIVQSARKISRDTEFAALNLCERIEALK